MRKRAVRQRHQKVLAVGRTTSSNRGPWQQWRPEAAVETKVSAEVTGSNRGQWEQQGTEVEAQAIERRTGQARGSRGGLREQRESEGGLQA